MSSDRGQDNFCGGMAEEILTALSKIEWISVITRQLVPLPTSLRSFVSRTSPDELGVRYLVKEAFEVMAPAFASRRD